MSSVRHKQCVRCIADSSYIAAVSLTHVLIGVMACARRNPRQSSGFISILLPPDISHTCARFRLISEGLGSSTVHFIPRHAGLSEFHSDFIVKISEPQKKRTKKKKNRKTEFLCNGIVYNYYIVFCVSSVFTYIL